MFLSVFVGERRDLFVRGLCVSHTFTMQFASSSAKVTVQMNFLGTVTSAALVANRSRQAVTRSVPSKQIPNSSNKSCFAISKAMAMPQTSW